MRSISNRQLHDAVVKARAMELSRAGETVRADVEGYQQPDLVFGYKPDIMTQHIISEVETEETYASIHTRSQIAAFVAAKNYQPEVIVPKSVYDDARRLYPNSRINWRTFKA